MVLPFRRPARQFSNRCLAPEAIIMVSNKRIPLSIKKPAETAYGTPMPRKHCQNASKNFKGEWIADAEGVFAVECHSARHRYVGDTIPSFADAVPSQQTISPSHARVDSRQRVIEDVHIRIRVGRPSERDALLLTSRQVDALLPDLRLVPRWQCSQVLPSRREKHVMKTKTKESTSPRRMMKTREGEKR